MERPPVLVFDLVVVPFLGMVSGCLLLPSGVTVISNLHIRDRYPLDSLQRMHLFKIVAAVAALASGWFAFCAPVFPFEF